MRNVSRLSFAVGASALLVGSLALPATAAETSATEATVVVPSGSLDISAPGTVTALDELAPGQTVTAVINNVTVTDERAGTAGWSVQVSLSNFVGGDITHIIPASKVTYTPGVAAKTGTSTVTASAQSDLSVAKAVQTATAVSGNNTATWNAELTVTAPAEALADTYKATLTHSFL